jgi:hypothetical protein
MTDKSCLRSKENMDMFPDRNHGNACNNCYYNSQLFSSTNEVKYRSGSFTIAGCTVDGSDIP